MVFLMIFPLSQNIMAGYRVHRNVQSVWKKAVVTSSVYTPGTLLGRTVES